MKISIPDKIHKSSNIQTSLFALIGKAYEIECVYSMWNNTENFILTYNKYYTSLFERTMREPMSALKEINCMRKESMSYT